MTNDLLPLGEPSSRDPQPPRREVFTVTELTAQIRNQLESAYPFVWIEGELSDSRHWKPTGHFYFILKDGNSQIRGVMFRGSVKALPFTPEDGAQVVVRGRISVYQAKGEYQVVAEHMQPHGVGTRQLAFDQLRRRLEEEGLCAEARKKNLPTLPNKIGIVTSTEGAALRDVMTVIARRFPSSHIVISPTSVQGEGASQQITEALKAIVSIPAIDVVILTRGGGSVEDLWAFNDETLARTIAEAPIPVISAIGHETDYTISDFVADHRAPTPSAAAEIVVAKYTEFTERITQVSNRLKVATNRRFEQLHTTLNVVQNRPGLIAFSTRLALTARRVDDTSYRFTIHTRNTVSSLRQQLHARALRLEALDLGQQLPRIRVRLEALSGGLSRAIASANIEHRRKIERAVARLESLSPLGVLARGFSVCWNDARTKIVRKSKEVEVGDTVRVRLHDGELRCNVTEAKPE